MEKFDLVAYSLRCEAKLGCPPLVRAIKKGPFDEGWNTEGRLHPERWRRKLADWEGNVAIVTGRDLVGFDADLYWPDAPASMEAFYDLGLPKHTITGLSGGGGEHLLYRTPVPIRCMDHVDGFPHVQIKGEGGALICPPSIHPDTGRPYEWEYGYGVDDDGAERAWLPPQIVELLQKAEANAPHSERDTDERDEEAARILVEYFDGHSVRRRHGYIGVTRPGKKDGGSATIGYLGPGVAKVWTPNWVGLSGLASDDVYPLHKLRSLAGIPPKVWHIPAAPRSTPNLTELLDSTEPEYEWQVPNLLERGDRVVLTGKEGYGKSTLLRQIGLGGALGYNSLSTDLLNRHHTPLRVVLVDLENSKRQLRREFRKQLRAVDDDSRQAEMRERFFVQSHPEGLVLNNVRDRDKDRAWLTEVIEDVEPDILILGPIYKMIDGDPSDEEPNRELVKWLDRLRIAYNLVLLLEAHTPHNANRPYGWSGWKRWPEFGIHLHQDGRLEHWRAMRDERPWPSHLARGNGDGWLWVPSHEPSEPRDDRHEGGIVDREVDVIRCLHEVSRPLSRDEITTWLGRQRSEVRAAIARLQERPRTLVVTTEKRVSDNGRLYPVELFALDPDGPFA